MSELQDLRRRALASGEPRDWQRLSQASSRFALDLAGQALPDKALMKFQSLGLVHPGGVFRLSLSPNGQYLASADIHSVRLWDTTTKTLIWQRQDMFQSFLAFDQFNRLHYSVQINEGPILYSFDIQSREAVRHLDWSTAVDLAMSPCGRSLAVLDPRSGLTLVSTESFEPTLILRRGQGGAQLKFSVSGDSLYWNQDRQLCRYVIRHGQFDSADFPDWPNTVCAFDDDAEVFAAWRGELRHVCMETGESEFLSSEKDLRLVCDWLLSKDGRVLVVACVPGQLHAWDVEQRRWLWSSKREELPCLSASSSDRQFLVGCRHEVAIQAVNWRTGQVLRNGLWPQAGLESVFYEAGGRRVSGNTDRGQCVSVVLPTHETTVAEDRQVLAAFKDSQFFSESGAWRWVRGGVAESVEVLPGLVELAVVEERLTGVTKDGVFEWSGQWQAVAWPGLPGWIQSASFGYQSLYLVTWTGVSADCYEVARRRKLWSLSLPSLNFLDVKVAEVPSLLWVKALEGMRAGLVVADLETGELLRSPIFPSEDIGELAAHPRLPMCALVVGRRVIEFFDSKLKSLGRREGHEADITALLFVDEGRSLVSVDQSGQLFVWEGFDLERDD